MKCLVNGKHTSGSAWERECPLNLNRVAQRQAIKDARPVPTPAQKAAREKAAEWLRAGRPANFYQENASTPSSGTSEDDS